MEKTDRRVRRTRTLLTRGLIQLMKEKDIKEISVKELSDLADINRGTFYLHYTDIYDLLKNIEDELFQEFNAILDRTLTGAPDKHDPEATLREIFLLLHRNQDTARVMMSPHGDLAFVNRLKHLVQERICQFLMHPHSTNHHTYREAFAISGCIGVIETWLNQPAPQTPEEMAKLCSHMLLKGLDLK